MEKINLLKKHFIQIMAIIGIIVSIKLLVVYFNANFVSDAAPSFCSFNETVDCDGVARTDYALFAGVPLAIYGLLFYTFVFALTITEHLKKVKFLKFMEVFKNPQSYIFSLSIVSVVISIALAWISHAIIHKICILCYTLYVVNICLLFGSMGNKSIKEHLTTSVKDFFAAVAKPAYAVSAVSAVIITSLALIGINKSELFIPHNSTGILKREVQFYKINKYKASGNILGDRNAKLILHEYTDFQCPACAISSSMVHRLVQEVDGVMVIHHDFPLDKACNPIMKADGHKGSCLYAKYGIAARKQGKFWDFANDVFEDNRDLTEAKLLIIAEKAGLDVEKLKADSKLPEVSADLKKDINKAVKLGITATPSYRVGLKMYEGLMPYEELKDIVLSQGATPKEQR